jgi:hypothetical protein
VDIAVGIDISMFLIGEDGGGRAFLTDVASTDRLFGDEENAADMMLLALWMRFASDFHIQQTVSMGEYGKMIYIGFCI